MSERGQANADQQCASRPDDLLDGRPFGSYEMVGIAAAGREATSYESRIANGLMVAAGAGGSFGQIPEAGPKLASVNAIKENS